MTPWRQFGAGGMASRSEQMSHGALRAAWRHFAQRGIRLSPWGERCHREIMATLLSGRQYPLSSRFFIALNACAPNRAQWMRQAAERQAEVATEPIGSPDQMRAGSRQASALLTSLAANIAANPPKGQQQAALGLFVDANTLTHSLELRSNQRG
jgi:hypothetical protein